MHLFPFVSFFRAQGFTCVAEAVGADHRVMEKTAKPQTCVVRELGCS